MMGYTGDVYGEWEKCLRYSSRSTENLIDVAWLGRMTGIDTSVFRDEVRALWKLPSYSYIKTELMPSGPIAELIKELNIKDGNNYRYLLRHQFYSKKSKRVSKRLATEILKKLSENVKDNRIKNFLKFAESPLSSIRIKSIEMKDYEGYVYDVSVPKSEMFWGGTTPILLHNSDERGINVVRGRIKDFAKMKPLGADFKIIFLDESDALTPEAQQALRRTMEKFSGACRFILSCNYSSRIIEPIQSRCAVFRFKGLTEEHVIEYVRRIVKGEKLQADEEGLKAIFNISEGDLRKATNILQAAAAMGKITKDNIYDIAMQANPRDVKDMLNLAVDGKFAKARGKLYELLINQGLSGEDIIKEMHRQVYDLDIDEIRKFGMIEKLGEFEFRLNQGGSEDIQLEALLANFAALKK
jgi:replication factor C small subunit